MKTLCVILMLILSGISTTYAQQRGKATYYSKRATGSRTSDGSRLHHDSLTCAHRTHPFGTKLKVTNLTNGKSVIVKVTDRGPYGRGRIVDLSYRAAREIGMLSAGVVMVELQVYNESKIPLKPEEQKYQPIEFDMAESPADVMHPQWAPENAKKQDKEVAKSENNPDEQTVHKTSETVEKHETATTQKHDTHTHTADKANTTHVNKKDIKSEKEPATNKPKVH